MNEKGTVPEKHLQQLKNISQALKNMRFVEGKTQKGYEDVGLTRRQIQHVESGSNVSLLKLITVLDVYGYCFRDLIEIINDV